MNYKVVPQIMAVGWPVTEEGYKEAHQGAQEHEREKFGNRRFKTLEKVIEKRIPRGELAGSHTRQGQIIISSKIPKKYHKQIVVHEKFEHARMIRKQRVRKPRQMKRR